MADSAANAPSSREASWRNQLNVSRSVDTNALARTAAAGRVDAYAATQEASGGSRAGGVMRGLARRLGPQGTAVSSALDVPEDEPSEDSAGRPQAQSLKAAINKYVWPMVADPTGIASIAALTFLQIYCLASLVDSKWTVKMALWEYVVLGLATFLEFLLLSALVVGIIFLACAASPVCQAYVGFQALKGLF